MIKKFIDKLLGKTARIITAEGKTVRHIDATVAGKRVVLYLMMCMLNCSNYCYHL